MNMNTIKALNSKIGKNYAFYNGDCVEVVGQMPSDSIDLAVYSPPFGSLYTYSDSERDMGNVASNDVFAEAYRFLCAELARVIRPGRLCLVHSAHTYRFKFKDGESSVVDFPGELILAHEAAGLSYMGRITIWKDPVTEMQRTKSHRLLYKNFIGDTTICAPGSADYLLIFRKMPTDANKHLCKPVVKSADEYPVGTWQEWASPVWMTIDQTNTLNVRNAGDPNDERHMCPLQLDVIERCVKLWSNPGEVVLSPFGGVASEGVGALTYGRRYVGVELKQTYWEHGCRHLDAVDNPPQASLFRK
jgi:hypothetical protein